MPGSGFDFLPVLEGDADVILSIDRGIIHQPVPAVEGEFRQLIGLLFDALFLCLQQLVCRPEEGRLNLLIRQVGRVAGLVAIVLVIAAPDDRLFFSLVFLI